MRTRGPVLEARGKALVCFCCCPILVRNRSQNTNHCCTAKQVNCLCFSRSKDYSAPVSFVSAGLRKTAAEEKQQQQQQKGEEGSDDSDDDAPPAPPPPRGGAPKKLQMVNCVVWMCALYLWHCCTIRFVKNKLFLPE